MIEAKELDRLSELEKKATAGPWKQDGSNCLPWQISPTEFESAGRRITVNPTKCNETQLDCIHDAKLIAALRNSATALIQAARDAVRLEADNKKLREEIAGNIELFKEIDTLLEKEGHPATDLSLRHSIYLAVEFGETVIPTNDDGTGLAGQPTKVERLRAENGRYREALCQIIIETEDQADRAIAQLALAFLVGRAFFRGMLIPSMPACLESLGVAGLEPATSRV